MVEVEANTYSFDEAMYLDTNILDAIDEIATHLFEIEESALMECGKITLTDRVLEYFKLPKISDLITQVPYE